MNNFTNLNEYIKKEIKSYLKDNLKVEIEGDYDGFCAYHIVLKIKLKLEDDVISEKEEFIELDELVNSLDD